MLRLSFTAWLLLMILTGCQGRDQHEDITAFIQETKARPAGKVKPLKVYAPYRPFVYQATQLRSPFEPPVIVQKRNIVVSSHVKPDLDRQKQRLEAFDLASLSMVGTVKKKGVNWGLVRDPEGAIDRVKKGDYLGRNHGRITDISNGEISVIEIIANGGDGWLERPNGIRLNQDD